MVELSTAHSVSLVVKATEQAGRADQLHHLNDFNGRKFVSNGNSFHGAKEGHELLCGSVSLGLVLGFRLYFFIQIG